MERSAYGTIGRLAGLAYLVVVVTGAFSLLYIWPTFVDIENAEKTAANIAASEQVWRIGIAAGILCQAAFLIVPVLLYRILESAGRTTAALMVVFAVASVPISFTAISHQMAILPLIDGAAGDESVRQEIIRRLRSYQSGIGVVEFFWGLWLLPFGWLVFKTGAIPRILGIFLMLGCAGYLLNFFGGLLIEGYADLGIATYASIPSSIGEIGACLWLLVMGARAPAAR